MRLHIGNKNYSSWSLRPWVLMTQLGIDFQEISYHFTPEGLSPPVALQIPVRSVPILEDEDRLIWDSLAIAEYLGETHKGVWPDDKAARAFARSAMSTMHASFFALRNQCSMSCGVRVGLNTLTPELLADVARLEAIWAYGFDQFGGKFLASDQFGAVDAYFCPVAFRVQSYGLSLSDRSKAYVERLLSLSAMQSWYKMALAETQRDPAHEDEILAHGIITHDYRAIEHKE